MKFRNSNDSIQKFLSAGSFAIAGVSRNPKKFGNYMFHVLQRRGISPVPVNPHTEDIDGIQCFPTLRKIPRKPEALIVVLPPSNALEIIYEAEKLGIKNIWLQQGAESDAAVSFCLDHNMNVVAGECFLMFCEPVGSFHKWHKWAWKLLGKLPR